MIFRTLKFLLFCSTFWLMSACRDETPEINNLNGDRIAVIGHRGCGPRTAANPLPENSMASVQKALELYAASGVEVDVQMSRDGVLFLYHDDYLETQTNLSGCIYQYTAEELRACKYKNSDSYLLSLEELFQYCSSLDFIPFIMLDNKLDLPCNISSSDEYLLYINLYVNSMHSLIERFHLFEFVYLESNYDLYLDLMSALDDHVQLMINGSVFDRFSIANNRNYTGIMTGNNSCTKESVAAAHASGLKVSIFGVVNTRDAESAIEKSPDFILTDDVPMVNQLLR